MADQETAKRLRMLRESRGLSRQQIADDLGMPKSTYTHYEDGSNEPRISVIVAFAQYFGISIDWLLGAGEYSKSPPPDTKWEALRKELETLPESEVRELMMYVRFLKWKVQDQERNR